MFFIAAVSSCVCGCTAAALSATDVDNDILGGIGVASCGVFVATCIILLAFTPNLTPTEQGLPACWPNCDSTSSDSTGPTGSSSPLLPSPSGCNTESNSFLVDVAGMPVVAAGLTWAKVEKMNTFTATCEPYTTAEICSCSAPDGGTRRLEDLDDGTEPLISDTSSWSRPKSWGMIRWLSVIIGVIACCIPVAAAFYVFKDYGDSDDSEIATMLGAGCCFCVILMLVVAYFYSGTPSPEYEAELEFVGESQQSIIAVGDVDEWMSLSEWHWKRWIGLLLMMCTCWGVFSVDDDDEKAAGILCCLLFLVAVILTTSAESAMTCPGGYGCDEICLSDPETCMAEQDLHPDWCSRHASLCPEFCKEHRDKCQMSGYIEPLVAQATTRLDGEWGHCTQPCGKNGTQLRQHYCPIAQTWHTYESNENMITMDGLHWLDEDVTNTEPDMWDEVDGQTVCIAVEETRSCNLFSCGCVYRWFGFPQLNRC